MKRAGEDLEPDTSKKQKSIEAPIPFVLDVPYTRFSSPKSSGTKEDSLCGNRDSLTDEAQILLVALAGLGGSLTPLGSIEVGVIDSQEVDVSYPLSMKLMEKMLKHKLEIDKDVVGNDADTAEQLIRFIKNHTYVCGQEVSSLCQPYRKDA
ncbi:hypothetical protein Tco_0773265 [Tanacetum coccineum]|uniref:Uncharacterized protein n=1 Tax=Tanacetum coccineum TaxID=301880 RepID=A0ABQ4ZKC6_9ASTR